MNKFRTTIFIILLSTVLFSCKSDKWKAFNVLHNLAGEKVIKIQQTYNTDTVVYNFTDTTKVYALDITAKISLKDENSLFQAVFVDKTGKKYLIFEAYWALDYDSVVNITKTCEETAYMKGVTPDRIELINRNSEIYFDQFEYYTQDKSHEAKENIKGTHDSLKLAKLKAYIAENNLSWEANYTNYSNLEYNERKNASGDFVFPAGLEYYTDGVYQMSNNLPEVQPTKIVKEWDWRNRHGINWMTPIRQQGSCGSCWIFSSVAATEALVNLYFNQKIDLDLSEQNVLSCVEIPELKNWDFCHYGLPPIALEYLKTHGTVDEEAYKYAGFVTKCEEPKNAKELIKITDFKHFNKFETGVDDSLKKMLIKYGPMVHCVFYDPQLKDQLHAMTNVGWKTDSLDGRTIWILKSSWGTDWGVDGYLYTKFNLALQTGLIYHIETPIISLTTQREVKCTDNDKDGAYFWGIGTKPKNCPKCSDIPDGDDSNPDIIGLDEFGNYIKK